MLKVRRALKGPGLKTLSNQYTEFRSPWRISSVQIPLRPQCCCQLVLGSCNLLRNSAHSVCSATDVMQVHCRHSGTVASNTASFAHRVWCPEPWWSKIQSCECRRLSQSVSVQISVKGKYAQDEHYLRAWYHREVVKR